MGRPTHGGWGGSSKSVSINQEQESQETISRSRGFALSARTAPAKTDRPHSNKMRKPAFPPDHLILSEYSLTAFSHMILWCRDSHNLLVVWFSQQTQM